MPSIFEKYALTSSNLIISEAKILQGWLENPVKIVITTHQKPDADALGSSLGLAAFLKAKGHDVKVITPTDYPDFLSWMHGNDEVVVFNEQKNAKECYQLIEDADLIFCLDFSNLSRIDLLGERVREAKGKKILVDHHLEPENFADFQRWSTNAAATCELVYELIADLGYSQLITPEIANCLYAGIMTDTGNFRHPNVTENVFRICAELIRKGAKSSFVSHKVYDNSSLDRLRLLGYCLKDKLTVLPEIDTAYITLSDKEQQDFNVRTGDTEGLVNYALSIQGIRVAALFRQNGDAVKMSFRSEGQVSVNLLAREHFKGGGHKNAAGGQLEDSLESVVERFLSVVSDYLSPANLVK